MTQDAKNSIAQLVAQSKSASFRALNAHLLNPKPLSLDQDNRPRQPTTMTGNQKIELPDASELWQLYCHEKSCHRVAGIHKTTGETIRQHLIKAGYRLEGSKWTLLELETLRTAYTNKAGVDIDILAAHLKRTEASIACKANDLKLTSPRGHQIRTKKAKAAIASAQKEVSNRPEIKIQRAENTKKWIREKGHPRGNLGGHMSPEHKEKLRQILTGSKHTREHIMKRMKSRLAHYGTLAPAAGRPGATWKQGWIEIGGKKLFARSSWESNYARYLQFQKEHGLITEWEHEPETFWFEGIKRGVCSYLPDFRVTTTRGTIEYHEVKGWMDNRSKTKIARMAKYHPTIKLIVIDNIRYKAIAGTARLVVPNWGALPAKASQPCPEKPNTW